MSKLSLVLLSLLAAIPGGVLAAQMVMAFMYHGGGSNLSFVVLAGLTCAVGATAVLMPLGVLIFGGSSSGAAPAEPAAEPDDADLFEEEADDVDLSADEADDFESEDLGDDDFEEFEEEEE